MSDKDKTLYITQSWVIAIFVYYVLLLVVGFYIAATEVLSIENNSSSKLRNALFGSVSIAISAAACAYIRKLYKLCFRVTSEHENEDKISLKRLGTGVYFFARPLFAGVFALFVVLSIRTGLLVSTSNEVIINDGFVYLSMFFSTYVGFLSGKFIKKIEKHGSEKLNSLTQ